MTDQRHVVAAIGCSGPVARPFVEGLIDAGVTVRLLARRPESVAARYPDAELIEGSMAEADDVARAVEGVDAAFVVTPMGMRNDPGPEVEVGAAVLDGGRRGRLRHLVYTSVLGADREYGVGILDAKARMEAQIRASGIPHSILRCGTYMEDVFDARKELLDKGRFLFPVTRNRRFTYTRQADVPRFVVDELLTGDRVLDGPINLVAPGTFDIAAVEHALSEAAGRPVKTTPKVPTYYAFRALQPYFHLRRHRFSSVIPLIGHFDAHGYVDDGPTVADAFPDFAMTTLDEHLHALFGSTHSDR